MKGYLHVYDRVMKVNLELMSVYSVYILCACFSVGFIVRKLSQ